MKMHECMYVNLNEQRIHTKINVQRKRINKSGGGAERMCSGLTDDGETFTKPLFANPFAKPFAHRGPLSSIVDRKGIRKATSAVKTIRKDIRSQSFAKTFAKQVA